jgi:hypothetical protein
MVFKACRVPTVALARAGLDNRDLADERERRN